MSYLLRGRASSWMIAGSVAAAAVVVSLAGAGAVGQESARPPEPQPQQEPAPARAQQPQPSQQQPPVLIVTPPHGYYRPGVDTAPFEPVVNACPCAGRSSAT